MVLLRILLIVSLLGAIYLIIQKIKFWKYERRKPSKASKMVACDYCGIFIPGEQAIIYGNKTYCCNEHQNSMIGK